MRWGFHESYEHTFIALTAHTLDAQWLRKT
jgi:hypothetical protein